MSGGGSAPNWRWCARGAAMTAVLALLSTVLLSAVALPRARGQAAWEYTPYQVRVCIALEPTPQLPPELIPPLAASLASRSETVFGAVWHVETVPVPAALRDDLLHGMEALSGERIAAVAKESLDVDKLYVASVALAPHGYDVALREVDGRTRQIGTVARTSVASLDALAPALWDLMAGNFTPLARIERVTGDDVVARLRAGGLAVDPASPVLVEKGMALRSVVRRNDRGGQPAKTGGISAIPWTLIRVEQRTDSLLAGKLFSGFRGALPARPGTRTERFALLVRPRWEKTQLILESRSDSSKRLSGYEIQSRTPEQVDPVPIGETDSFGSLELPRGDGSIQLLFVRNGRQLLARLPVLPGQDKELVASLADDDGRLQAEGFVLALQSRVLDLVARREILAARFRARVKEGKLDEAQTLLEEFRKLETRLELTRALDEAKQAVVTGDRLTQLRIDKLFADAGKLLAVKQLSDELLNQLTRELTTARGGGAVASKS